MDCQVRARGSEDEAQEFVENLELALHRSRVDAGVSEDAGEDVGDAEGEQAECSKAGRGSTGSLPALWQSTDQDDTD